MKHKLIIFPYSGTGMEALDCLTDEFEFIGFVHDDPEKIKKYDQFEVFSRDFLQKYPEAQVLAVPGSPTSFRKRNEIIDSLGLGHKRFAQVIHPTASVGISVTIGFNTLIMAGCVLTSNAVIGNHICILPNSVVHHDSVVGDYTLIGSNVTVAGNVNVGSNCYIGSGVSIINGVDIGSNSLIGIGSNVIKPVAENSKMAGNPARPL